MFDSTASTMAAVKESSPAAGTPMIVLFAKNAGLDNPSAKCPAKPPIGDNEKPDWAHAAPRDMKIAISTSIFAMSSYPGEYVSFCCPVLSNRRAKLRLRQNA